MTATPTVFDIFDCQKAGIETPSQSDILCGKDKTYGLHPGNIRFRQLIEDNGPSYAVATTKQGKMKITKSIVDNVQQSGARFLEKVDGSIFWTELANAKARDKTSHALRFFCKHNNITVRPRTVSDGDKPPKSSDTTNSTDTILREFAQGYLSSPAEQEPALMMMEVEPSDTVRSTDMLSNNGDTWRSRDAQGFNLDTLRSQDLRDIMECVPTRLGDEDADAIMAMVV